MLEHKEISRIYNGDLIDFMNEGHIRLIPSAPGINLVKEPTTEQWSELSNYINYYLDKNKVFYIDINNENGNCIKSFIFQQKQKAIDTLKNCFKRI